MKEVQQTGQQAEQVKVNIQAQYVKKVSFESPSAPNIFTKMKEAPKVDLDLDVQVKDVGKDQYEVTVVVKAKALKDIETIFTVNLEYSGLFEMKQLGSKLPSFASA